MIQTNVNTGRNKIVIYQQKNAISAAALYKQLNISKVFDFLKIHIFLYEMNMYHSREL